MPLGAFAYMPLRLGEGLHAAQHARLCADLLAARRACPLLVLTFTHTGAAIVKHEYFGMNGEGLAFSPSGAVGGTGVSNWNFPNQSFEDPYEIIYGITPRCGNACAHSTSAIQAHVTIGGSNLFAVTTTTDVGAAINAKVTVVIW